MSFFDTVATHQVPERFVARRPSPHGPGWEILIRWSGLGYASATWELEGSGIVASKKYSNLLEELWSRQSNAAQRSTPEALSAEHDLRPSSSSVVETDEQPSWVSPGQLKPHQIEALNWLRRYWAVGQYGVLADDPGLGRSAVVAVFLKV